MTEFTPISSTVGGILIGLSSLLMLGFNGRIAGISGIVGGIWGASSSERAWRAAFLFGLLGGGLLVFAVAPRAFGDGSPTSLPWLVVAGLLVGFGTRTGNGCTSGHGVCGMSRLSPRSIAATLVFMAVAAATVFVTRHLVG
ncbi:MAG: YeeE/YedE thiosulfate transporter family protein [Myxococcota bacterium]